MASKTQLTHNEALRRIGSPESSDSIVTILKHGKLASRLNAVLAIKELVSSPDEGLIDLVAETEGLIETLAKLIKEPVSPNSTKASLLATFYLVSSNEKTASRFVESGLVTSILEILVDAEKGISDKALGVLDGLCGCESGREAAYDHELAVPVIVKKILRVSETSTEFAVSALWRLCKGEGGVCCLVEALKVGAFQKLLLLLQVGCSEETKGKANDLLKMMNGYRGRLECVDSMDFKGLKRPF